MSSIIVNGVEFVEVGTMYVVGSFALEVGEKMFVVLMKKVTTLLYERTRDTYSVIVPKEGNFDGWDDYTAKWCYIGSYCGQKSINRREKVMFGLDYRLDVLSNVSSRPGYGMGPLRMDEDVWVNAEKLVKSATPRSGAVVLNVWFKNIRAADVSGTRYVSDCLINCGIGADMYFALVPDKWWTSFSLNREHNAGPLKSLMPMLLQGKDYTKGVALKPVAHYEEVMEVINDLEFWDADTKVSCIFDKQVLMPERWHGTTFMREMYVKVTKHKILWTFLQLGECDVEGYIKECGIPEYPLNLTALSRHLRKGQSVFYLMREGESRAPPGKVGIVDDKANRRYYLF